MAASAAVGGVEVLLPRAPRGVVEALAALGQRVVSGEDAALAREALEGEAAGYPLARLCLAELYLSGADPELGARGDLATEELLLFLAACAEAPAASPRLDAGRAAAAALLDAAASAELAAWAPRLADLAARLPELRCAAARAAVAALGPVPHGGAAAEAWGLRAAAGHLVDGLAAEVLRARAEREELLHRLREAEAAFSRAAADAGEAEEAGLRASRFVAHAEQRLARALEEQQQLAELLRREQLARQAAEAQARQASARADRATQEALRAREATDSAWAEAQQARVECEKHRLLSKQLLYSELRREALEGGAEPYPYGVRVCDEDLP